jgi:hypothetical protein
MTTYANVGHVLLKRGNTIQSAGYTGPRSELTHDTGPNGIGPHSVRIHDNATPGGTLLATQAQINTLTNSISVITGIDATFVANINVLLSNAATQQSTINLLLSNAGVQADAITSLRANIVAANLAIAAASGTYSNTNVSAYLTTQTFYSNANVESYFGANVGSLWSNAATQATSINTITANIGSFYTYANLHFADSSFGNSNVAAYLPTYSGNIAANIVKNGYAWRFGTDGTLTLPGGSVVASGFIFGAPGEGAGIGNGGTAYQQFFAQDDGAFVQTSVANAGTTFNTWQFGLDGTLTLPGSAGQIGRSGYTDGIDLYNNNGGRGYVRMNYADESFVWADSGGSHIQTTGGTWDFGTNANLTLPSTGYLRVGSGIVAGFASSPAPVISGFSTISAERFTFLANGVNILSTVTGNYGNANVASYLPTYSGNISANVVKNGYTWRFGTDGSLTLPNGAVIRDAAGDAIAYGRNAGLTSQGSEAVAIGVAAGGLAQGTGAVAIGSAAGLTNQGINSIAIGKVAGPTNQANNSIILNATGTSLDQTRANTFTVAPVRNDVANVSQVMFYNTTSKEVTYGNVISVAGNINASQFNFANGVNILSTVAGTYSNANVASYLTTATITTTGNVTAGNISGSGSGLTGVALKTIGSWTVTTGTNTYSFTVPVNGVYQMWVECNIPNGILAYQATATVTNSNVPVVGAQYAWVYTGGGTPIDFTSIPNQFVGTGNTIVRSSVAPSATTNRFDFGINNTSGSSQTVSWGYIRID